MAEHNKTRLKYICSSFNSNISTENLDEENGFNVYGASGLIGYNSQYRCSRDYLGIVKDGAGVGRINKYPAKTSLLGTMAYIFPNAGIDIDWLKFCINSLDLSNSVDKTTIPHIYFSEYGNRTVYCPERLEQEKIARFLDKKCFEIDALVADIQSEIETLEEYKKSVITEAVTKGLNPDAQMKDSGSEWIGYVPEDWDIIRIGHLFSMRNDRNSLPEDKVQLLSLYTGIGVFPAGEHEARGNKAQTVDGYKIVKKNDIVVNIILAWMGAIGISEYDGVTSPAYDIYVPDTNKVVPHFYHYVFRTPGIAGECFKYGRGIMLMRWRTYSSEFKQILVPFPSIEIQQQIADYLDEKVDSIDKMIELKKQQIETLEEYKKSVIYEYVTGKKEVPEE